MELIEKLFKLKEANTTLRRELMAGLTGFVTVAYVLFVVPSMLADAGMPRADATVAVVWVTAIACLIMGLYANFPVIVAPGLGITAFFSYYVCGPMGMPWQGALAAVFISGVIFFLLTVFKIRELIIRAVPLDLKYAIVVGLGCFIAFIGMKNAGIIIADPATFVGFGHMNKAEPLLACLGVLIISALMAKNVRGAMLIGIIVVTAIGVALGVTPLPSLEDMANVQLVPTTTLMQMDFAAVFSYGIFAVVFTLTMVDLFDNMGTLIGLSQRAGLLDTKTGHVDGLNKALLSDSVATMSAAAIGTPTATSYVESAAAIAEGGRTGIVPIVTAILFICCLFVLPLVNIVPAYATASALIVVGALMMQSVRHIHFDDFTICLPAFLTILTMPLTFNVATGFGLGFISYVVLSIITGKAYRIEAVGFLIAIAFAVNFCLR